MSYIQFLRQYVGHEPILTAGTGILVFNEKNEVLVQLRTDTNTWGFPGGCMELGESFEETAKREFLEETGLVAKELVMLDILSGKETFRTYPNGDQLYDITAIYKVTRYEGELKADIEESRELRFFDIDDLPKLTSMSETIINKVRKYFSQEKSYFTM